MEIGVCKQCGRETFIQNKTKCLCSECVYKNNHGGKSRFEVAKEKQMSKPIKFPKPKPVTKKYVYKRKTTGEKKMFLKIWGERFHVCSNCGKLLGDVPKSYMFSHREAKGANGKNRLNPDNIDLLCFDCHFARDMQSREVFDKRKDIFKKD